MSVDHAGRAEEFNSSEARVDWHNETLWLVRNKRDKSSKSIPEWEELREQAAAIKSNMLSHMDEYLLEFERKASENGIKVHWAADAAEHNQIVSSIIREKNGKKVVKSKSMLTEECGLNHYLEEQGIEVTDTDLGERIVQLEEETPSHIVLPAIHKTKEEVGDLFHRKMGTPRGLHDPVLLAEAARIDLRAHFLQADVALTGVNFAIAESGGFVVCTNEGNADMGAHLAPVHIACMGIEKLIPKAEHLGVFLRLLARSATGQPITAYSSLFHKPRPGTEIHIVLVDNGRSELLGKADFRRSLNCIRCGACMNTCPVYRRSGGHSYGAVIPGPIGSILSPNTDLKKHSSLPFASTLCGSCSDVCPVKIDIHTQLYKWRQIIVKEGYMPVTKKWGMQLMGMLFSNPFWFQKSGSIGRKLLNFLPKRVTSNSFTIWGKARDLPVAPKMSFQEWYRKNRKK